MTKNKNKITIGINAMFLRKPQTGIGQVTTNFLQKLAIYKNKEIKPAYDNNIKGVKIYQGLLKRVKKGRWLVKKLKKMPVGG